MNLISVQEMIDHEQYYCPVYTNNLFEKLNENLCDERITRNAD